jgi:DMSO reductase anchor subunit
MKPESDYRSLSKSWLRFDGNGHILLAAIYAFLGGNATFFAIHQAIAGNWAIATILAAVASVLWAKTISNGIYAARCLSESNQD